MAETTGLLNRRTGYTVPRVRISSSPQGNKGGPILLGHPIFVSERDNQRKRHQFSTPSRRLQLTLRQPINVRPQSATASRPRQLRAFQLLPLFLSVAGAAVICNRSGCFAESVHLACCCSLHSAVPSMPLLLPFRRQPQVPLTRRLAWEKPASLHCGRLAAAVLCFPFTCCNFLEANCRNWRLCQGEECRFLQFIGDTNSRLTAMEGYPVFPMEPKRVYREHLPLLQVPLWRTAVPDGLQEAGEVSREGGGDGCLEA